MNDGKLPVGNEVVQAATGVFDAPDDCLRHGRRMGATTWPPLSAPVDWFTPPKGLIRRRTLSPAAAARRAAGRLRVRPARAGSAGGHSCCDEAITPMGPRSANMRSSPTIMRRMSCGCSMAGRTLERNRAFRTASIENSQPNVNHRQGRNSGGAGSRARAELPVAREAGAWQMPGGKGGRGLAGIPHRNLRACCRSCDQRALTPIDTGPWASRRGTTRSARTDPSSSNTPRPTPGRWGRCSSAWASRPLRGTGTRTCCSTARARSTSSSTPSPTRSRSALRGSTGRASAPSRSVSPTPRPPTSARCR